jgi:hypothetical protein
VWDIIPSIKSPYTLAAFLAAVVATILWRVIDRQRKLIVSAPEKHRAELVRNALEFFQVDTGNLTREQQYNLALQQIRLRARRFLVGTFASVFVLLVCAIVVIQNGNVQSSRDDARARVEFAAAIAQAGAEYPQLIAALRETRVQLAVSVDGLSKLPVNDPGRAALQVLIERSRNQVAQIESQARSISVAVDRLMGRGNVESELRNQVDALRSQTNVFDKELAATNSQLDRTIEMVAASPQGTTGTPPAFGSQTEKPFAESESSAQGATDTASALRPKVANPFRAAAGLQGSAPGTTTRPQAAVIPDPPTNVSVQ